MRLTNEEGAWKVQWDDGLILPELIGRELSLPWNIASLHAAIFMTVTGMPIVSQSDALPSAFKLDEIDPDMRGTLTGELGKLCGYRSLDIEAEIDATGPGQYLPMCEGDT